MGERFMKQTPEGIALVYQPICDENNFFPWPHIDRRHVWVTVGLWHIIYALNHPHDIPKGRPIRMSPC